jgi:hypothetical protein
MPLKTRFLRPAWEGGLMPFEVLEVESPCSEHKGPLT